MTRAKKRLDYLVSMRPSYWLQNNRYNAGWDKALLRLLETAKFEYVSSFEAKIGPLTVWIENHPYASFSFKDVRPSRSTIALARRLLIEDIGGSPSDLAIEAALSCYQDTA